MPVECYINIIYHQNFNATENFLFIKIFRVNASIIHEQLVSTDQKGNVEKTLTFRNIIRRRLLKLGYN
jgi:hypothetical protein